MRAPRAAAAAMPLAACLLFCGIAGAEDEWKEDGGEEVPPDDHPLKKRKKRDAKPKDPNAKQPRFLFDLKVGPAFFLGVRNVTDFGLQINLGYAVAQSLITAEDSFYLVLSPSLIFGEDLGLTPPLGVQYDLPLKMIPYDGIFAYARVAVGYLYYVQPGAAFDNGLHGVAVQPGLGAKIDFLEHFHVGIEPIGFNILTTIPPRSTSQPASTLAAFQLYIFGGARF